MIRLLLFFAICSLCQAIHYEYSHRPGKDCEGHDIHELTVTDLQECQYHCDKTCHCKSIQYHGTYCFMKNHVCTAKQLRDIGHANDYVKEDVKSCEGKSFIYQHRKGKDCAGHDIRQEYVADLAECKADCDLECECKSIQYHGTYCFLKKYVCTEAELRDIGHANDYVKEDAYTHRPGKDCAGHDIHQLSVTNLQECQAQCDKTCGCLSIQYHGTYCFIKNYVCTEDELRDIGHANDYVKKGE